MRELEKQCSITQQYVYDCFKVKDRDSDVPVGDEHKRLHSLSLIAQAKYSFSSAEESAFLRFRKDRYSQVNNAHL